MVLDINFLLVGSFQTQPTHKSGRLEQHQFLVEDTNLKRPQEEDHIIYRYTVVGFLKDLWMDGIFWVVIFKHAME